MTSIAPSSSERAAERPRPRPTAEQASPAARIGTWYVRLFLLASFFPYPALPLGNRNGLQLCEAMAFAAVLALALRPPSRPLIALILLLCGISVSNFVNQMRYDPPQPDVMVKEAFSYLIATISLWPSTFLATRGRFRDALVAASLATLVHAAVGAYQLHAFSRDEFPLLWLYRNPSFMPMESWAEAYAKYMKRPCGLFPEPSAMGAALGPWLVLVASQCVLPVPSLRIGRGHRRLFLAATVSGFALLGLSRSGSSAAFVGALVFLAAAKARPLLRGYGTSAIIASAAAIVVAAATVGYLIRGEGGDFDSRIDSSWGLRGRSIYEALTANFATPAFLTGLGAGQSEPVIQKLMADVRLPSKDAGVAVWSLAGAYYMDHGLIGGTILLTILWMMITSIRGSSEPALGFGALLGWIAGPTVVTSYLHIVPIWVFMGALLEWDRIFPRRPWAGEAVP